MTRDDVRLIAFTCLELTSTNLASLLLSSSTYAQAYITPSTHLKADRPPQTNASIVRDLSKAVAEYCPKAFVGIISNPVNSTVPISAEVLKKAGVYDPKRLAGVTSLDVVRQVVLPS